MKPYLNSADLADFCGYKRESDQRRWLKENGIQHLESRRGPCTTLEWINNRGTTTDLGDFTDGPKAHKG